MVLFPLMMRPVTASPLRESRQELRSMKNSIGKNDLVMSEPVRKAMTELRKFMFESLYLNPTAKSEEAKADKLITELYRYYVANTDKLPDTYKRFITEFDERPEQVVCDYIAGMSDQYSISKFQEIFVPKAWKG